MTLSKYVACIATAYVISTVHALAETRVALVIGNATYQNTAALANPVNDAEDMAAALRRVGFDVVFERNLDKRGMERAVARFARAGRDADVVLFYYAGHGLQHRGANYLMPVDAKLEDEFSLDFELSKLDDILNGLDRARGIKILILDACRRNPLVDKLAGLATTRDFAPARGLARLDAKRGMVVAYSTQADQVAIDGAKRNSPFTAALVKKIGEPGVEIGTLFRRVAAEVYGETGGRQLPELSVSLLGEFYFTRADSDVQAWDKLRPFSDPNKLKEFIDRYSASPLVTDARQHLELIERADRARVERERAEGERLVRERLSQEQAERVRREQAEQERVERERLAREQADRERLAREQADRERARQQAPTNPSANTQTAMLTSPSDVPASAPPAPPSLAGGALVEEIKKELTRVGCYAGPIDGKWPTAVAKAAVEKLAKYANLREVPDEAIVNLLETLRGMPERVCPLECTAREFERNGTCVTKTCPDSFVLDAQGTCERQRSRNIVLNTHAQLNKDCSLAGLPTIRTSTPPRNGNVSVTPGAHNTNGNRPTSFIAKCRDRLGPTMRGVLVVYRPNSGFNGTETIGYTVTYRDEWSSDVRIAVSCNSDGCQVVSKTSQRR